MGIEPMALGLALRRSNYSASESTPHLNHHIQLRYHRTADNVTVAWLSGSPAFRLTLRQRRRCRQCDGNEVDSGGVGVGSQLLSG